VHVVLQTASVSVHVFSVPLDSSAIQCMMCCKQLVFQYMFLVYLWIVVPHSACCVVNS